MKCENIRYICENLTFMNTSLPKKPDWQLRSRAVDESESRWVASAGHSNVFSSLIRDVLASVRGDNWGANSKCLIRLYNRAVGTVWG